MLALVIGGGVVALVTNDDGSNSGTTPTSDSTSTTEAASSETTTPASSDPGGTPASGGAPGTTTATVTTSTTRPLSPVTGLAPVVSETGHHFGMVAVGTTSGDWPIVVSNPNTVPIEISIAGGAAHDPFDGNAGTCGGNSLVLPPGGSCRMPYNFTPTAVGSFADSTGITVTVVATNAAKSYTLSLAGIGK